jgi:hypothetical protein
MADLLAGQAARLRRRYLVHGLGWTLLLPAAAIGLFFGLDHTLHLPLAVRLLHTTVTIALLAYGLQRFLLYPLSRRFQSLDIAQALERVAQRGAINYSPLRCFGAGAPTAAASSPAC